MQDQDSNHSAKKSPRPPLPQTGNLSRFQSRPNQSTIEEPITPEMLVPRLGDLLLEKGLIRADQLQHALDYQRANSIAGNPKMIGQVLIELGYVNREILDRVITEQILALQNALKNTNSKLEMHVQQRTGALEWRLVQIRTAAEVAQRAISATKLEDLLETTVNLIVERFRYYYAAIFLLDEQNRYAVLRDATGIIGKELKNRGYRIAVGSQSVVGWVTAQKDTRIISHASSDPLYLQDELLPDTQSEACIPLLIDAEIVGVLDVQSQQIDAFNQDDIAVLQTLANQIASSIKTLRLLELTQINLHEVNLIYDASSKISKSSSVDEAFQIASSTLKKAAYLTIFLTAQRNGYQVYALSDPDKPINNQNYQREFLQIDSEEINAWFGDHQSFRIFESKELNSTHSLLSIPHKLGYSEAVVIPIWNTEKLTGLWLLGAKSSNFFNKGILQPYLALAEFTSTALTKISALENAQTQVNRLKTMNSFSQAIVAELELNSLFSNLHEQISRFFGDVGFYIALYDQPTGKISFPYLYEEGELIDVAPIPLGKGLTSTIINTRKPLLLAKDTENRARELGALHVGKLAKSWLGVPLIIGDEILGVMTIQDIERENAFFDDDVSLLTVMASQVAVALRNARLVNSIRKHAEQQRLLYEITEKIRRSVDMNAILETTTTELGKVLGARKAHIELRIGDSHHDIKINNDRSRS